LTNHHLVGHERLAAALGAGARDAQRPAGLQAGDELTLERAAALHVQSLVDRLVGDPHRLLIERGVPEVWRRSITEAVGMVGELDQRLRPLEVELRPLARSDSRVALLVTIPGIRDLLGLTIASEIGAIARFASARKLVG
jgi:transposase